MMEKGRLGIALLFAASTLFAEKGLAQTSKKNPSGTETIYIPSDMMPPPSAEKIVPKTPFYSQPTSGNEVLEDLDALKRRVDSLENSVEELKKQVKELQSKASGTAQGQEK